MVFFFMIVISSWFVAIYYCRWTTCWFVPTLKYFLIEYISTRHVVIFSGSYFLLVCGHILSEYLPCCSYIGPLYKEGLLYFSE
jgi:hypothetical protein